MKVKLKHEIRDPINGFIKVLQDEREILDSLPLQRLRDITQLSLTYLLYPSATHKRFEHSLGVMELATRVFDVITAPENISLDIERIIPEVRDKDSRRYWRRVIRIAALCHDIGHLPFSHAGEKELFPEGWNHERMTAKIIKEKLKEPLRRLTPPVRVEDVIKIAIGPRELKNIYPDWEFSDWETILSEIIVGDAFGVDRMDYLLRDSHHIGVAYGKFDHFRLIDTLRILPDPQSNEPKLGIEIGGLHVAESLLLARYFMYSQVYFHHIRRIYDIHLKEFLKEWLKTKKNESKFPTNTEEFLSYTDSIVLAEIYKAANDSKLPGHEHARRIAQRDHFKLVYERSPADIEVNLDAVKVIYEALQEKYGEKNIAIDEYEEKGGIPDFLIIDRNEKIISAFSVSDVLSKLPKVITGFVFINPEYRKEAKNWLDQNKNKILKIKKEVIEDE